MVSKITESVVGVAEYPAAEETMHAMTQANLPARPGCERRTRLAIRGSFDIANTRPNLGFFDRGPKWNISDKP